MAGPCSRLKSDATTRDILVVVVSIVDEHPRGTALGAAAYLVKPVSRDTLLGALTSVGVPAGQARADSLDVTS